MRIFDSFKKKKAGAAPSWVNGMVAGAKKILKADAQSSDASKVAPVASSPSVDSKRSDKKASGGLFAHRIIIRPRVTEKSARLHGMRQYIFQVHPSASKINVRRAIFELYHVKPTSVRIVRISGKTVRRGRVSGTTASYKKAIVTVPVGATLPVYEGV